MDQSAEPPATMNLKAVSEIIGVLIGVAVLTMVAVNVIMSVIWFFGN